MQNSRMAAGKTAKRTLVIFRDCHSKNNLVIHIEDHYEERFYRNYARRMGWPCTIRRPKAHTEFAPVPVSRAWRKPPMLPATQRPRLGGAFNLVLTSLAMEGGEV